MKREFSWGNPKKKDHTEGLGVDGDNTKMDIKDMGYEDVD
jgi:hypothetical protein